MLLLSVEELFLMLETRREECFAIQKVRFEPELTSPSCLPLLTDLCSGLSLDNLSIEVGAMVFQFCEAAIVETHRSLKVGACDL